MGFKDGKIIHQCCVVHLVICDEFSTKSDYDIKLDVFA